MELTIANLPASILAVDRALSNGAAVRRYPVQTAGRLHVWRPLEAAGSIAKHRALYHGAVKRATCLIRLFFYHPRSKTHSNLTPNFLNKSKTFTA